MESSSDFIVPVDFSSEWQHIQFVKANSKNEIYTAMRYGRRYVLKKLVGDYARLTNYEMQQEQEFLNSIQLVHPNIAATYAFEEIEGVGRCIVMEWIDGVTLGEWLQTKPSKAVRERVFMQIVDALEYIHRLQLVHHDVKGDNILVTHNGQNAKLIDFGLSQTDDMLTAVPNDPRKDIEALQRLFPDICPKKQFFRLSDLRNAINRRKRIIRLLPVILSALLLAAAITLFYLSWHERQKEQQRFESMTAQVDAYIAKERAYLLEMINSCDTFDSNNPTDMQAYAACYEAYSNYVQSQWLIRDSLVNLYPENDPMREQCWHLWVRREAEMNTELLPILSSKLFESAILP